MYGFSTLTLSRRNDTRRYGLSQINTVRFFLNDGGSFELVREVSIDRTKTTPSAQVDAANPLCAVFRGEGSAACR
jgi:hypothetical protein